MSTRSSFTKSPEDSEATRHIPLQHRAIPRTGTLAYLMHKAAFGNQLTL
jgi:hypothetical protein